jgi:hypothetical protein
MSKKNTRPSPITAKEARNITTLKVDDEYNRIYRQCIDDSFIGIRANAKEGVSRYSLFLPLVEELNKRLIKNLKAYFEELGYTTSTYMNNAVMVISWEDSINE